MFVEIKEALRAKLRRVAAKRIDARFGRYATEYNGWFTFTINIWSLCDGNGNSARFSAIPQMETAAFNGGPFPD
jgi:hypothetical protein